MSKAMPVRSDRCGLDELFVSFETGDAERARLALGPGWTRQWTATWQVPGGGEVSLVRDLGPAPVAGCEPVRRFSWGRRQRHRPGLQFMVSTGRVHGFESLEEQALLLALDFTGEQERLLDAVSAGPVAFGDLVAETPLPAVARAGPVGALLGAGVGSGGGGKQGFGDLEVRHVDGGVHVQVYGGVPEVLLDPDLQHRAVAAVQFDGVLADLEDLGGREHLDHVAQPGGVGAVLIDGERGVPEQGGDRLELGGHGGDSDRDGLVLDQDPAALDPLLDERGRVVEGGDADTEVLRRLDALAGTEVDARLA